MCLFLISVQGALAESSIAIGNEPGRPGATVPVPVTLRNSNSIVAAQFDFSYDEMRVTPGELIASPRLANYLARSRQIAPGVRRALIYSMNNTVVPGTNGPLLNIPFTVSQQETVSSGPLTLSNVILATAAGNTLAPVSLSSGTIFLRPVNFLADGHVQFFLPSSEGQRYAVQATSNLVDWVGISTNVATSGFLDLLDVNAARSPYRFYRWQLLGP